MKRVSSQPLEAGTRPVNSSTSLVSTAITIMGRWTCLHPTIATSIPRYITLVDHAFPVGRTPSPTQWAVGGLADGSRCICRFHLHLSICSVPFRSFSSGVQGPGQKTTGRLSWNAAKHSFCDFLTCHMCLLPLQPSSCAADSFAHCRTRKGIVRGN